MFVSKDDFRSQARTMQGSRDFGAQLFCAVLRAVAVEARLVCSLQPLSFSGTTTDMTPSQAGPQYIVVSSDDHETSTDERQKADGNSPKAGKVKRIGRPEFASRPVQTSARLGKLVLRPLTDKANMHRLTSDPAGIFVSSLLGRGVQRRRAKMDSG